MKTTPRNPFLTVDVIIEIEGGIILIKRRKPPPGWAIPGGFVDYGESLEDAVRREAKEETGLDIKLLKQFHTYSDPERDPRHHTVSTIFIATASGKPEAGDDAEEGTTQLVRTDHGYKALIQSQRKRKRQGRNGERKGKEQGQAND